MTEAWGAVVVGRWLELGLLGAWLVLVLVALRPRASCRARLLALGMLPFLVPPLLTLPVPRPTLAVEIGGREVLLDTAAALGSVAWAQVTGMLVGIALLVHSRVALARALRRADRVIAGPPLDALRDVAAEQGIPTPRLFLTAAAGPAAAGVLRPAVLLPRSLARTLAPDALRMVLAHEVAHVARRDLLMDLLRRAAVALWWFHPASWILARMHRSAAEDACDDIAASPDPEAYCAAILAAAGPAPAAAAALGHPLERRFRRLLRPAPAPRIAALVGPRAMPWLLAAVAVVAVATAPLRFVAIDPVPAGWASFDLRNEHVMHNEIVIRHVID